MFYVYALTDPRNGDRPFYIGKGVDRRAWSHLLPSARKQNCSKMATIKAIRAEGLEPGVKILEENLVEQIAFEREIALIREYGRKVDGTGCLTNLTLGGDGISGYEHSEETKDKMRKPKNRTLPTPIRSEESKSKSARSMIGKPGRATGYQWTDEQKALLSERRKGSASPTKGRKRVYREDGTFYFSTQKIETE